MIEEEEVLRMLQQEFPSFEKMEADNGDLFARFVCSKEKFGAAWEKFLHVFDLVHIDIGPTLAEIRIYIDVCME